MERPQRTALLNPGLNGLTLFLGHPSDPVSTDLLFERRLGDNVPRLTGPVHRLVVAVRKAQAVAEHDEDLIFFQVLVSQKFLFIGEIDGEPRILYEGGAEGGADVIRIMRFVAAESKRRGLLCGCPETGSCR